MYISLESPKYANTFVKFIEKDDEIVECHYLAGDYDYALKIITENTETLEKILTKSRALLEFKKLRPLSVYQP